MFIHVRNKKVDDNNNIIGGTASIMKSVYVRGKNHHSKQVTIERLGKIIILEDNKKKGIFNSPIRGLVHYDVVSNKFTRVSSNDSRIKDKKIAVANKVHTVFGDSYLLLEFLNNNGLLKIFREMFEDNNDYERLLVHLIHDIMRDGSHINCENYVSKSFLSYVTPDLGIPSLKCDSRFFKLMGNDDVKLGFFKKFISMMRKNNPNFGKATYVDSTPLPNDIINNPFNALSVHGVSQASIQMRLVLILDQETGLPVWYEIIPGNVLDINTLRNISDDVSVSLDIIINDYVLDAGYVSKRLIKKVGNSSEKTIIARMPSKKGFPYKELYKETKDLFHKGKYQFMRGHYTYFGIQKNKEIFDTPIYEYVYLDHYNANKGFNSFLEKHEEDYLKMKNKEKDFKVIEDGFFVLISNQNKSPKEILENYYSRTEIENVFKTAKEYLKLLPIKKWNSESVKGKILTDMINAIIYLMLRKILKKYDKASIPEVIGATQSLMCFKDENGIVTVEYPNKKVKEYYKALKVNIPDFINTNDYIVQSLKIDAKM